MAYLKYRLDRSSLETIYKSFIRPILEYGDILLSNMTDEQATLIEQLNKRAGSIISGATRGTSSTTIYNELAWVSMAERRKQHRLCAFHKIINNVSPSTFGSAYQDIHTKFLIIILEMPIHLREYLLELVDTWIPSFHWQCANGIYYQVI